MTLESSGESDSATQTRALREALGRMSDLEVRQCFAHRLKELGHLS